MFSFFITKIDNPDFSDQELGKKCEDECEMVYLQCVNYCSNNSCLSECARVYQDCNNSCPCSDQCPNGCEDCPNPICTCGLNPSSQNLDNLKNCTGTNSMELGECILDCNGGSKACDESCVDDFRTQQESCPCQVRQYSVLSFLSKGNLIISMT